MDKEYAEGDFYWAKQRASSEWEVAQVGLVWDDGPEFYFPAMDWMVPAFAIGPRVIKPEELG